MSIYGLRIHSKCKIVLRTHPWRRRAILAERYARCWHRYHDRKVRRGENESVQTLQVEGRSCTGLACNAGSPLDPPIARGGDKGCIVSPNGGNRQAAKQAKEAGERGRRYPPGDWASHNRIRESAALSTYYSSGAIPCQYPAIDTRSWRSGRERRSFAVRTCRCRSRSLRPSGPLSLYIGRR